MTATSLALAPSMTYEEARGLIQDGDLVSFVPHDRNILHVATQLVTKSLYYHSGMAVWMHSTGGVARLFCCEAHREGRRLVPMSLYEGTNFDVTKCPIEYSVIEEDLLNHVGRVPYGFVDFLTVGARDLFGVTLKNSKGEICSEMVQNKYREAGMRMPSEVLSPGGLYTYLKSCGIQDRVHVVHDHAAAH